MKKKILFSLLSILLPLSLWAQEAQWQCNPHQYQHEMTACVVLKASGAVVTDYTNFEVAAFCGDECRGVTDFVLYGGVQKGYLRIYGNQDNEVITFKAYDKTAKKVMAIPDSQISFQNDATQGTPEEPIVLTALYDFTVIVAKTGNGSVSEGAVVREGNSITLTATPDEGHYLSAWTVNGKAISSESPYVYTPTADVTVTAVFEPSPYKITYYMDDGETVYKVDSVKYGTVVAAPASPVKEGYTFKGWDNELPETMPASELSFKAKFAVNQYTVKFVNREDVLQEQTLDYGAAITLPTVPPWDGHQFVAWTPEVAATVPAQNVTYTAVYDELLLNVTYMVDGEVYESFTSVKYADPVPTVDLPSREGYTFSGWSEIPEKVPANDLVITGSFSVNTYQVDYQVDGESYQTMEVAYGQTIPNVSDPSKEGYSFKGWSEIPATMPAQDVTITANFEINKYRVIFIVDGSIVKRDTLEYGASIVKPEDPPAIIGYTFAGWGDVAETVPAYHATYTAVYTVNKYSMTFVLGNGADAIVKTQDYATSLTAPEDPVWAGYTFAGWTPEVPDTIPASDMIFRAQWNRNSYVATFISEGDTVQTDSIPYEGTIVIPARTPTKVGYTFAGWTPAVAEKMPAEDVTYTATFTINQYTMTFVLDNGAENVVKTQDYATSLTAPANLVKTGFTFKGWSPEVPDTIPASDQTFTAQWERNSYLLTFVSEGDTVQTDSIPYEGAIAIPAGTPTKVGYTFAGWTPTVAEKMPAEDVTYTATFTINQYTMTFVLDNGAENVVKTQDYATSLTAPANLVKTGFTFKGWSPEVPDTIPASDQTFTAQWERNSYLLTFVSEGDTVQTDSIPYEGAIAIPAGTPTKVGYTFAGWTPTVAEKMPAEDVTYTATFTINQYTMTFVLDNGAENVVKTQDYATSLTAPANLVKTGFTFKGWSPAVPNTIPASDQTFTVQWERNSYLLTFLNGNDTVQSSLVPFEAVISTPAAPTKEGYTFKGWTPAVAEKMPAEDVTYRAEFTVNIYAIRYYVDGKVVATDSVAYGSPVILNNYVPSDPSRYTFTGWDGESFETMPAHDLEYTAILTDGIISRSMKKQQGDVYNLNGVKVRTNTTEKQQLKRKGVYIMNGRKYFIK